VAVTIRDARPAVAPAIAELHGQLGYPGNAKAVRPRIERMLAAGDRLVVAEVAGRVAGLANLHVSPSIEYDAPAAKLGALVVDEVHRGIGVGRALVAAMEEEARARGCAIFFLTTAARRRDAHLFYERLGFEQTGRRYAKPLQT
jgi:GNAT superfamily N-acetyltransferase